LAWVDLRIRFSREAIKGFSLIELLVVITIGGILASIVWLRLSYLAPRYRLEGAARALAAEIQKARGRAIAEGKCVEVLFDTSAKTYRIATLPGAAPCPTSGYPTSGIDTTAALNIDESGTIGIEKSGGGTPPFPIFSPRGPATFSTGDPGSSIRLFNNLGEGRLVLVNSAGRVSVP